MLRRRPGLWLVLATLCLAAPADRGVASGAASPEAGLTLQGLMERLAGSGGVRARFVETRHLALLSEPLESEGRLYFAPPDRMARVVTRPHAARMVIRGDALVIDDPSAGPALALGANRMAREMVDNVLVILSGDLETLRQRYLVSFGADDEGWQLRLEPRARGLRRFVEAIELSGRGAALERMEVRETGGDRTVTRFLDVETGVDFAPAEDQRLFSLEAGPDPTAAPPTREAGP